MTIKLTDEKKHNLIQDGLRLQDKREVVILVLATNGHSILLFVNKMIHM